MLRKLQKLLELCIAATAGIYLGKVLWMWMDYRNHPALYVQDSISFSGKMSVISGIAFAVAAVEAILSVYPVSEKEKTGAWASENDENETSYDKTSKGKRPGGYGRNTYK